jgi:hypothetical protein
MNPGNLARGLAFLALLFGSTLVVASAETPGSVSGARPFSITSIEIVGTNLVLHAEVPTGLGQVTLQMRPRLDGSWEDAGSWSSYLNVGTPVFTIARPTGPTAFFRLKANANLDAGATVSGELQYVTTSSLDSHLAENGDAIFHFIGWVDGSDNILITREGALWNHVSWGWPREAVIVNGTQWKPNEKNYLTTTGGGKFLPEPFSLESASLEVLRGRDVVALERCRDGLIVHVDDTPPGADTYEFNIRFQPVARNRTASASTAARLKIAARIDGSDCFKITAAGMVSVHKYWRHPKRVTVNDIIWSPEHESVLKNEGETSFLPADTDLSTARIVSRRGRDLATMWAEHDAVWVWFADNPNGDDSYELEIAFGQ